MNTKQKYSLLLIDDYFRNPPEIKEDIIHSFTFSSTKQNARTSIGNHAESKMILIMHKDLRCKEALSEWPIISNKHSLSTENIYKNIYIFVKSPEKAQRCEIETLFFFFYSSRKSLDNIILAELTA